MNRQSVPKENDDFMVGEIRISLQHNMLSKAEQTCRVQPKAMAVLHYLACHHDRVISNEELIEQVWQGRVVTNSSVQKSVNTLRSAFKKLDSDFDYLVYFSKRGYQLISPTNSIIATKPKQDISPNKTKTLSVIAMVTVLLAYFSYTLLPNKVSPELKKTQKEVPFYTQVKPFASNTGREQIIAPHPQSQRIAFIRNEYNTEKAKHSLNSTSAKSQLYIQGTNGQQWQVAVARGNFVQLSWSDSGRNLVAIDAHYDNSAPLNNEENNPALYYSFHIYTLDFKAEKVIEKNLLSHWSGDVNSVTWWDENTLEFIASHGADLPKERYRYDIAEQNLSTLKPPTEFGQLLNSDVMNKKTALLAKVDNNEHVYFLDETQKAITQWPLPFNVKSMHWLSNEKALLILSTEAALYLLYTDGEMQAVNYSPKVKGLIKDARSKSNGESIILTVEATTPVVEPKSSGKSSKNNGYSQTRFLAKGGGFIYSATDAD